jgi:hypothetical protein
MAPNWEARLAAYFDCQRPSASDGGEQLPLDIRRVILDCIRDPGQLQPTYDRMQGMSEAAAKAKNKLGP